ncbi:MAG: 50S ribosomal protein L32 [Planctomycetes bacterium]|nr:50S ribosomal protein L32 [Planctomycetota bacterium]
MPVPKKRKSKARIGDRRGHHKLTIPQYIACPSCGTEILPHRVCYHCGTYQGRTYKVAKTEN